jgi:hypothetical protein
MANKVEALNRDIAASKLLVDLMTIFLGERILPKFKRVKIELYRKVLQQYAINEIANSHKTAGFWAVMLENETIKNSK